MKHENRIRLSEISAPIAVVFIGTVAVGIAGGILGLIIVLAVQGTICP